MTSWRDLITVDGSEAPTHADRWVPERYRRAVLGLLDIAAGCDVGRLLLLHLQHPVLIAPFSPREGSDAIATTGPAVDFDARPLGELPRMGGDDPERPGDETGEIIDYRDWRRGTGEGTGSTIRITPGLLRSPSSPAPAGRRAALYADTVLVHELVHAVRNSWAVNLTRRFEYDLGYRWRMGNSEEYYAWLIENMYSMQRGYPLHAAYDSNVRLRFVPRRRAHAARYLELEREWVSRFFLEIPTLANGLAAIPPASCAYNPFRNFMENDYRTLPTVEPIRRVPMLPLPYNPYGFNEDIIDPWADDPD